VLNCLVDYRDVGCCLNQGLDLGACESASCANKSLSTLTSLENVVAVLNGVAIHLWIDNRPSSVTVAQRSFEICMMPCTVWNR